MTAVPERQLPLSQLVSPDSLASPSLVAPASVLAANPRRATARLWLPAREVIALAGLVDEDTPPAIATAIANRNFGPQRGFAGLALAEAGAASTSVTRYVLDRILLAYRTVFGEPPDPRRVWVTARVDRRSSYRQVQGPHIDWTRLSVFHDDDWRPDPPRRAERTLRSLQRCHSLDCVLGGPPTEFFLDSQPMTVNLMREDGQPWLVDTVDFPAAEQPSAGRTGQILYRPPFTVHQFPARSRWSDGDEFRLFVSADFFR
jgi:hypothetical protein